MRGWVIYQTGEQLSINANQKEILLATSSQETQPILATPTAYHSLVSPSAGPTRPRLGLHPITICNQLTDFIDQSGGPKMIIFYQQGGSVKIKESNILHNNSLISGKVKRNPGLLGQERACVIIRELLEQNVEPHGRSWKVMESHGKS